MKEKITVIIILMFSIFVCGEVCAKEKANKGLSYEIKCAGNGQQGYYLVEVTAYVDSKADVKIDNVKKCAVHGVLFKGFSGENGCKAQKPILSATQEQQYADFFNSFFKSDYLSYVSVVDPTVKTTKVGKQYAITSTLQVSKDELRKALEDAGIARKLGFN